MTNSSSCPPFTCSNKTSRRKSKSRSSRSGRPAFAAEIARFMYWMSDSADHRRLVNYETRRQLLAELEHLSPEELLRRSEEGLPKLWIIRQTLRARCSHARDFGAQGTYTPLWATGAKATHLVSFQRGADIITIAPAEEDDRPGRAGGVRAMNAGNGGCNASRAAISCFSPVRP